ncbi:MAG: gamma-glutamyl kinase [Rhizobium sp.]|nr:gamma-glutamyl kinase [Rhizobium sp.]
MIYLHHARLVILSQPKTGTTALDHALSPRASIAVNNPPPMKHIPYHKFMTFVAPWLQAQTGLAREQYDVVSVMREPVDWLGSWYRYRTREQLKDAGSKKRRGNYTGNVSFDAFVQEVLKPKSERATYAGLGSPCGVALRSDGGIGCDRIFPYEDLSGLHEMIQERTKRPVDLALMNVSPDGDMTLAEETRARLTAEWRFAFDLHASLNRDGAIEPRFKTASDADAGEDSVVTG